MRLLVVPAGRARGGDEDDGGGSIDDGPSRWRQRRPWRRLSQPWGQSAFDLALSPKLVCLVALAVQNAALAIVMHHSRVNLRPDQRCATSTAVLLVELLKGTISLAFACAKRLDGRTLKQQVLNPDALRLAVPAALYVLQQRLQYSAAANLDPSTFTVSCQAKILTTAVFSYLLLRTRIRPAQWLALVGLAIGVAIVQIQSIEARVAIDTLEQTMKQVKSGDGDGPMGSSFFLAAGYPSRLLGGIATPFSRRQHRAEDAAHYHAVMNPFVGFLAVGAACLTSGFAGVYFEMLLKGKPGERGSTSETQVDAASLPLHEVKSKSISRPKTRGQSRAAPNASGCCSNESRLPSLWIRNVQLSLLSLPPALIPVLYEAYKHHRDIKGGTVLSPSTGGPFANITQPAALLTIAMQVTGGLLTALVVAHADNILKGFAIAFSVLLTSAYSVLFAKPGSSGEGGVRLNIWFFVGSALTLASTFLYNRRTASQRQSPTHRPNQDADSSDDDDDDTAIHDRMLTHDKFKLQTQLRTTSVPPLANERDREREQPVMVSSAWSSVRRHSAHSHQ